MYVYMYLNIYIYTYIYIYIYICIYIYIYRNIHIIYYVAPEVVDEESRHVPGLVVLLLDKGGRRCSWNPSGKCSYERPTRGTVCGTMRSMCGADAGCLATHHQSLGPYGRQGGYGPTKYPYPGARV